MKNVSSRDTLESMSQAVWYNRWTLNKFKKYLKGNILEVGCGIGNFTKGLKEYGDIYAVDIDESYINEVKKLVNVKAGFGDIETGKYFFDSTQFDSIVCLNVLEHIQNDNEALKNLYQLLKKNGFLILLLPAHTILYGEIDKAIGHFRRYEKERIVNKLKRIGFNIIFSRKLNFLGGLGWWVAGKLFKEATVTDGNIRVFNLLAPIILPMEDIIEPPFGTSILIVAKKL